MAALAVGARFVHGVRRGKDICAFGTFGQQTLVAMGLGVTGCTAVLDRLFQIQHGVVLISGLFQISFGMNDWLMALQTACIFDGHALLVHQFFVFFFFKFFLLVMAGLAALLTDTAGTQYHGRFQFAVFKKSLIFRSP